MLMSCMSDVDPITKRHPSAEEQRWSREVLDPLLAKAPERPIGKSSGVNLDESGEARFTTVSEHPVQRLYTPADLPEKWEDDLGEPGQPPYTRGIHPSGYRGKLWTMRQFAGFGTPADTNARYKSLDRKSVV